MDADVVSECKHRIPREEGIGAMHKLQEIIAVIAGATCSTGRNIRNFIVHFRTRCGQSRIVLSVSVLPLSLLMHAHTLTPAKRFSFADLQHLRSVGDVQISPDGHAIVYSLYSIDIQHDRFERRYPVHAIYTTDLSGHATRLTRGNDSYFSPKASPDLSASTGSPDFASDPRNFPDQRSGSHECGCA